MSKKLIAALAVGGLILLALASTLFYFIGQSTNPEVEVTRVVTEQVEVPAELPTQYAVDPLAVAVGQANATQAEITRIQAEIVVAQAELKALVDGNATLSEIATKEAELNDLITRAEALIEQSGLEVDNLNELAEVAMTATAPAPSSTDSDDDEDTADSANTDTTQDRIIKIYDDQVPEAIANAFAADPRFEGYTILWATNCPDFLALPGSATGSVLDYSVQGSLDGPNCFVAFNVTNTDSTNLAVASVQTLNGKHIPTQFENVGVKNFLLLDKQQGDFQPIVDEMATLLGLD